MLSAFRCRTFNQNSVVCSLRRGFDDQGLSLDARRRMERRDERLSKYPSHSFRELALIQVLLRYEFLGMRLYEAVTQ